jgi:16S rRNA C967 or C1407 C5-methylase (RsmB/RsmF family)
MTGSLRTRNVERVVEALSDDVVWREGFFTALADGDRGLTAVSWITGKNPGGLYELESRRPAWLPEWIDVVAKDVRVGVLPAHDAGEFYLLDVSSTFALAPLADLDTRGGLLIDVCAAPGGKGIVAQRYCQPEVLIGNEVIRKRTAQLISNYKRCSIDPALVTSVDPKLIARLLESKARVVIVDAPCSGQALILKGMSAPGAFHPTTIAMNERRQRRILAESSKLVMPGGYLLYSTCTFSPEENERNVEWFIERFPELHAIEVGALDAFRSTLSEQPTYRLYPQGCFGAGAFCCLLKRDGESYVGASLVREELPAIIRPVWRSASFQGTQHEESSPSSKRHPRNRVRGEKRSKRWRRRCISYSDS